MTKVWVYVVSAAAVGGGLTAISASSTMTLEVRFLLILHNHWVILNFCFLISVPYFPTVDVGGITGHFLYLTSLKIDET